MSHELHFENGKASMMYVGKEPWHGLGTKLNHPATAEEAIKAANLDWKVVKKPLFAGDSDGCMRVGGSYVVVREDKWGTSDCEKFGIVGKSYTPLQNREAFKFFDPLVGKDAAIYHTAGALGKGERIWLLAKLPGEIKVAKDDITNKYLLLSNTHDGSSSVQVKFTPIRVVCQNTLTMALSGNEQAIRVSHFSDMHKRLAHADEMLGVINSEFEQIEDIFCSMAGKKLDSAQLEVFVQAVFPLPQPPAYQNETSSYQKRKKSMLKNREITRWLFKEGKGNDLPGVKGSLWAAYNAVAENVDQYISLQAANHDFSNTKKYQRLHSVWFGDGYTRKCRAFKAAKDILK